MRILLDARHIRDFGFGTYIRNIVRAFVTEGAAHEFFLAVRPGDVHEFDSLPPNFHIAIYERSDEQLSDNIAFPLWTRKFKPDLIHIPLNVVPALLPRPYVVTVHDLSSLMFGEERGAQNQLRMVLMRRGLQRAAKVIAVSESTRQDLIHLLGVPAEKVERIYGAADPRFANHEPGVGSRAAGPSAWEDERRRTLARYQIHYPFLLYAGAIRPQKNLPRLVEAFSLVKSDLRDHPTYKDLRLIIIGDEISRNPALRKAVIQSRVETAVRFLGFVPLDTLRFFYGSAEAFVFPSLYEGFGLPPLEAMAAGTPVICSNVTSLPEVVADAAMFVSPDNVFDIARGIREVLEDPEMRAEMVRRGLEQSRCFRWDETARELLRIYEAAQRA